ncbi:MAG TPA: efflux RND transporter periplasmic adaptor subunit [bacterium]
MRRNHFLQIGLALFLTACGNGEQNTFVASGIIEGTTVKVPAQTGGLLLSMNVDEGQDVQLGQVVAVVDTEKLVYQLQQIESGLQEVAVQRRINVNLVEKAQADFQHVETKYNRYRELYEKNSASQQAIDDLKNAYDLAITQLENAQQNLKIVEAKQGSLEAQAKLLKRQIADATIKAGSAGTVSTKYYETGEMAPTGTPVVEIVDLQNMWTKVYVSELTLPKIKIGQPAEIRIDGTEQKLSGRVSWISPKAEFTPKNILTEESRTSLVYAVKVEVENPDRILKHGMPVEIALVF